MRTPLWHSMIGAKYRAFYLYELAHPKRRSFRMMDLAIALITSGSIASWAIWQEWAFMWSFFICISQVIQISKPFLPFHQAIPKIETVSMHLHLLELEYSKLWRVLEKDGESENLWNSYYDLKEREIQLTEQLNAHHLKDNDRIAKKVAQRWQPYLRENFELLIPDNNAE